MEDPENSFYIDTKGFCFVCLNNTSIKRTGPGPASAKVTSSFSFTIRKLAGYLKVDLQKVFSLNAAPTPGSKSLLDEAEIFVTLCKHCYMEATKFDQLYQELKKLQMRVNGTVRSIHQLMVAAENNPQLTESYRARMVTNSPLDLIQKNIAEGMRRETIQKCSLKVGARGRGRYLMIENGPLQQPDQQLNFNSRPARANYQQHPATGRRPGGIKRPLMIKGADPAAAGSNDVSPPPKRVKNKINRHAPVRRKDSDIICVDLEEEDNDPLESPPPPATNLVISSVSSANGLTYSRSGASYTSKYFQSPHLETVKLKEAPMSSAIRRIDVGDQSSGFRTLFDTSVDGLHPDLDPLTYPPVDSFFNDQPLSNVEVQQRQRLGEKLVKCINCHQTFTSNSNLRNHTLAVHRTELFSSFKKPGKSDEEFRAAVDKLFHDYKAGNDDFWQCLFCEKTYRYKNSAEAHMVQQHYDHVSSQLTAIQEASPLSALSLSQISHLNRSGMSIFPAKPGSSSNNADNLDANWLQEEILNEAISCGVNTASSSANNEYLDGKGSHDGDTKMADAAKIKKENSTSTNSSFTCEICNKSCSDLMALEGHKLLVHSKDPKIAASPSVTISCPHCPKRFSFHHSQRLHVLTLHRWEELSRHLPKGTTKEETEPAVTTILNTYVKLETGKYGCGFAPCPREFTQTEYTMLQNHILLSHFKELVIRLRNAVSGGNNAKLNETEVADIEENDSVDKVTQAPTPLQIKTEPEPLPVVSVKKEKLEEISLLNKGASPNPMMEIFADLPD